MGMIIGGAVLIYLLTWLFEKMLWKRVLDTPEAGIPASVATAIVAAVILYGFGNADGGPWNPWPGGVAYIIGGAIVLGFRFWELGRKRAREAENDLGDVFD